MVNKWFSENAVSLDIVGIYALFTVYSPWIFGEQPVHINLWAEINFLLKCFQFIERTWRAAAGNSKVERHRIIPGDRGKIGSGWLIRFL